MSNLNKGTIRERLSVLETLMCNHLKHHETYLKVMLAFMVPLLTGVIAITYKIFWG